MSCLGEARIAALFNKDGGAFVTLAVIYLLLGNAPWQWRVNLIGHGALAGSDDDNLNIMAL